MALLELRGVSKRYRQGSAVVNALDEVDVDFHDEEFTAIVGPSGSGKSTLLHLAGGLDLPDSGTVHLNGRDIGEMSMAERATLRRRDVSFIFQFFHLIPTLTVAENVELPLMLDGRQNPDRVEWLLDQLGIGDRARHLPTELSGGQMQRTAIARALITKPRLLLADEPTGNLDSTTGAVILDILTEAVSQEGTALIVVTHDQSVAQRAERVLTVRDGKIGSDQRLRSRPSTTATMS